MSAKKSLLRAMQVHVPVSVASNDSDADTGADTVPIRTPPRPPKTNTTLHGQSLDVERYVLMSPSLDAYLKQEGAVLACSMLRMVAQARHEAVQSYVTFLTPERTSMDESRRAAYDALSDDEHVNRMMWTTMYDMMRFLAMAIMRGIHNVPLSAPIDDALASMDAVFVFREGDATTLAALESEGDASRDEDKEKFARLLRRIRQLLDFDHCMGGVMYKDARVQWAHLGLPTRGEVAHTRPRTIEFVERVRARLAETHGGRVPLRGAWPSIVLRETKTHSAEDARAAIHEAWTFESAWRDAEADEPDHEVCERERERRVGWPWAPPTRTSWARRLEEIARGFAAEEARPGSSMLGIAIMHAMRQNSAREREKEREREG